MHKLVGRFTVERSKERRLAEEVGADPWRQEGAVEGQVGVCWKLNATAATGNLLYFDKQTRSDAQSVPDTQPYVHSLNSLTSLFLLFIVV
jgi:hypothetical protein